MQSLNFIKEKSNIINPDKEIAEEAADISMVNNLGAVDAIIYTTALKNNVKLFTLDNDFRSLQKVEVLD